MDKKVGNIMNLKLDVIDTCEYKRGNYCWIYCFYGYVNAGFNRCSSSFEHETNKNNLAHCHSALEL